MQYCLQMSPWCCTSIPVRILSPAFLSSSFSVTFCSCRSPEIFSFHLPELLQSEAGVFSVAGPVAWNSLPTDLKDGTLTFPVFKRLLKTHLFVTIWTAALRFCGDCMKGALQVPVSIQRMSHDHDMTYVKKMSTNRRRPCDCEYACK